MCRVCEYKVLSPRTQRLSQNTMKKESYNPFEIELDEEVEAQNSITYWFPILEKIGMRVPKTIIVHTGGVQILRLADGELPDNYMEFHTRLADAIKRIGFPCFLRSGMTSDKHSWKNSCYITKESDLKSHLSTIIDTSICANIAGYPFDTSFWAVRELIPTTPLFHAFPGSMPITKERRVFIKNGKLLCNHTYWPDEAFSQYKNSIQDYDAKLKELQFLSEDEEREMKLMAEYIGRFFKSAWSIDFLQSIDGKWWVTDMAVATRSYHFADCKNNFE